MGGGRRTRSLTRARLVERTQAGDTVANALCVVQMGSDATGRVGDLRPESGHFNGIVGRSVKDQKLSSGGRTVRTSARNPSLAPRVEAFARRLRVAR